jgi:hypothetical protein
VGEECSGDGVSGLGEDGYGLVSLP